ncbi:hypothetical protein N566_16095 [Streptomycetaceae bacterium MP113-05]|nr:hypothetical protein N566_16095 [Streptomycetaceae bacterium MP113-05]
MTHTREPTAPESARTARPRRTTALFISLVVLAACAVGGGWWWYQHRDSLPDCTRLLDDRNVRRALAPADGENLDCAALAARLRKTATSGRTDRHTPGQVRALTSVLTAVDHAMPEGPKAVLRIDPELRVPLAKTLAEYPADTRAIIIRPVTVSAGDEEGQDGQGPQAHLSVSSTVLVRAMRAASESTQAFSTLHTAHVEAGIALLNAAPPGAGVDDVKIKARVAACALGTLDAIHHDALRDAQDEDDPEQEQATDRQISDWVVDPDTQMNHHLSNWAERRGIDPDSGEVNNLEHDVRNDQNTSAQTTDDILNPEF